MDIEREALEADVVIVGAGPAGISCAIHLLNLIKKHNHEHENNIDEGGIYIFDKAAMPGNHTLSGAIMDPQALLELLPDFDMNSIQSSTVIDDAVYYLTNCYSFKLPYIPASMHNKSLSIISLGKLVKQLVNHAENLGANIVTGMTIRKLLIENNTVQGVQTEDKGIDHKSDAKENFEPGLIIKSPITILADGCHGTLSQQLITRFNLDEQSEEQIYGLGFKELWNIPDGLIKSGTALHSFGYPLAGQATGGGWLYSLSEQQISIGLVVDLNYSNPELDPFIAFQRFKSHPMIENILHKGERTSYGAKATPKGGYDSCPVPYANGALLLGDCAGMVDTKRLKGIHLAIKSGILAAETTFKSMLENNYTTTQLKDYDDRIKNSYIGKSLWQARNHQQAINRNNILGYLDILVQEFTNGSGLFKRHRHKLSMCYKTQKPEYRLPNGDAINETKVQSLYFSSNAYTEDQPVHIGILEPDICSQRCTKEYGNPCQYFCPANVYEVEEIGDKTQVKLSPANCLACKTCDILDPYGIINWQPPEGGDGPRYEDM